MSDVTKILERIEKGDNKASPGLLPLVYGVVVVAALATSASGGNGTILQTFPGTSGPGYKAAPDCTGGVGPNHVVDFADSNFTVHDRVTGQVVPQMTMPNFWAWVQPSNTLILPTPNDPRMLYDSLSGRWIATCANDQQDKLFLAVSTSSDPTQPWNGVLTPFLSPDFGFRMGVDKNGFYGAWWNTNWFDSSFTDTHTGMDGCAIPIADLIAPGGPDLVTHLNQFHNFEIESFPATDPNPNKLLSDPEVFLNKQFPSNTVTGVIVRLCMYKVTWSSPTGATMSSVQYIPLSRTYWGPNGSSGNNVARQPAPGNSLRADEGRRTISAFAYGGRIIGCNGAKNTTTSLPGVLWYDVRVSDGALLQEGFVDDPLSNYTHPSLAVDAGGNIGIGCTRTSTNEFPSVCIMVHGSNDPPSTTRLPILAVPGTTYYRSTRNPIPWGNYSSTCIDPNDARRFWTYQEYANSTNSDEWCTAWASFQINALNAPIFTNIRSAPGSYLLSATGFVTGVDYVLQSTTNLVANGWSNTMAFKAPAPFVTLTNSDSTSTQKFYRIAH